MPSWTAPVQLALDLIKSSGGLRGLRRTEEALPSGGLSRVEAPADFITPEQIEMWLKPVAATKKRKPAVADEDWMMVQHNLSAASLAHVDKKLDAQIPAPSIAITRPGLEGRGALTRFGDISLIYPQSTIKPGPRNPVVSADAYTPGHPPSSTVITKQKALNEELASAREELGITDPHRTVPEDWTGSPGMHAITHERLLMMDKQLGMLALENDLSVFLSFMRSGPSGIYEDNPIVSRELARIINDAQARGEFVGREAVADLRKRIILESPNDAPVVGADTLLDSYDDYVQSLAEIGGWKERILRYTPSGKPRYVPYTVPEIVKEMRARAKSSDEGSYPGPGEFRARVTPSFRTQSEIKEARHKLQTGASMEEAKELANSRLWELITKFEPYLRDPPGNRFLAPERTYENMLDALKTRRWDDFFEGVPEELKGELDDYAELLRGMPTEYFEAKPYREVPLSEARYALVPKEDARSKAILEKEGVEVHTYTSPEDKHRQFGKFKDVMFTVPPAAGALGALLGEDDGI